MRLVGVGEREEEKDSISFFSFKKFAITEVSKKISAVRGRKYYLTEIICSTRPQVCEMFTNTKDFSKSRGLLFAKKYFVCTYETRCVDF